MNVAAIGYQRFRSFGRRLSDPAAAEEIAYYQQMEDGMIPDVWSAYWHNGRIYANDNGASRGLSVYEMEDTSARDVLFFQARMNPQVQFQDF